MKRLFFILSVLILASCASETQYATRAEKLLAEINDPASDYVMVIAHRGDWRNYPENSIPAIESVIRMGVDIVEIDLKMTKDSVLVLAHDGDIDRLMNGTGWLGDYTLAELKELRLKRAHGITTDSLRIATLEEALIVCKDRILVNLDHSWNYYDEAIKVAEKLGVTDQILMKGQRSIAEVDAKLASHKERFMYMPIVTPGNDLFKSYEKLGIDTQIAYEVCWDKTTPEVVDCIKTIVDGGSKAWVNTIWGSLCGYLDDDAALEKGVDEIYGKVIDMGVTMIQTDRPELLIDYLESKGLRD